MLLSRLLQEPQGSSADPGTETIGRVGRANNDSYTAASSRKSLHVLEGPRSPEKQRFDYLQFDRQTRPNQIQTRGRDVRITRRIHNLPAARRLRCERDHEEGQGAV